MSRIQRVNQLIREEISHLVQRELKDPRLGFVTVTEVDVSKDLRTAKVYVSVLGPESDWQGSLQALESARGFIRSWLVPRLRLRAVPTSLSTRTAPWRTRPTSRQCSRGSRPRSGRPTSPDPEKPA